LDTLLSQADLSVLDEKHERQLVLAREQVRRAATEDGVSLIRVAVSIWNRLFAALTLPNDLNQAASALPHPTTMVGNQLVAFASQGAWSPQKLSNQDAYWRLWHMIKDSIVDIRNNKLGHTGNNLWGVMNADSLSAFVAGPSEFVRSFCEADKLPYDLLCDIAATNVRSAVVCAQLLTGRSDPSESLDENRSEFLASLITGMTSLKSDLSTISTALTKVGNASTSFGATAGSIEKSALLEITISRESRQRFSEEELDRASQTVLHIIQSLLTKPDEIIVSVSSESMEVALAGVTFDAGSTTLIVEVPADLANNLSGSVIIHTASKINLHLDNLIDSCRVIKRRNGSLVIVIAVPAMLVDFCGGVGQLFGWALFRRDMIPLQDEMEVEEKENLVANDKADYKVDDAASKAQPLSSKLFNSI
jgi:hypothetical protein